MGFIFKDVVNLRPRDSMTVTKVKTNAREAFNSDQHLFLELVASASDFKIIVILVTDQFNIVYANEAACQHFGVDLATITTWTPANFDDNATPEALAAFKTKFINGESDRKSVV